MQAMEAIKLAAGIGTVLARRLLIADALSGRFTTVQLRARCCHFVTSCCGLRTMLHRHASESTLCWRSSPPSGGKHVAACRNPDCAACGKAPTISATTLSAYDYGAFTGQVNSFLKSLKVICPPAAGFPMHGCLYGAEVMCSACTHRLQMMQPLSISSCRALSGCHPSSWQQHCQEQLPSRRMTKRFKAGRCCWTCVQLTSSRCVGCQVLGRSS
jgi:hypothetical protein